MRNKILINKFKAVKSFFKLPFVTYQNLEEKIVEKINENETVTSLETDLSQLENRLDDKLSSEDFEYELSNCWDWTELKDQVEELQDNNELNLSKISDESHPISQLIDQRNDDIIQMITDLENRFEIAEENFDIAMKNLAVKTEQLEKVYERLKALENQPKEFEISKPIEVKLIKD